MYIALIGQAAESLYSVAGPPSSRDILFVFTKAMCNPTDDSSNASQLRDTCLIQCEQTTVAAEDKIDAEGGKLATIGPQVVICFLGS